MVGGGGRSRGGRGQGEVGVTAEGDVRGPCGAGRAQLSAVTLPRGHARCSWQGNAGEGHTGAQERVPLP